MKNITKEDYLRAVYHLTEENEIDEVSSVDIQKYLKLSKPSISEMIRKLANENLIHAEHYQKVKLTKKGLLYSIEITRKHRVIEVFLKEILKINNNQIHEEAHRLEHAFSDDSIKSISNLIKNKNCCPHGKKIPKIKGE